MLVQSLPLGHVFWEGSSRAFRKCAEPGDPEVTWLSGQAAVALFAFFATLAVIGTVCVTGLQMKPLEASSLDSVNLILILIASASLRRGPLSLLFPGELFPGFSYPTLSSPWQASPLPQGLILPVTFSEACALSARSSSACVSPC